MNSFVEPIFGAVVIFVLAFAVVVAMRGCSQVLVGGWLDALDVEIVVVARGRVNPRGGSPASEETRVDGLPVAAGSLHNGPPGTNGVARMLVVSASRCDAMPIRRDRNAVPGDEPGGLGLRLRRGR